MPSFLSLEVYSIDFTLFFNNILAYLCYLKNYLRYLLNFLTFMKFRIQNRIQKYVFWNKNCSKIIHIKKQSIVFFIAYPYVNRALLQNFPLFVTHIKKGNDLQKDE